MCCVLLLFFSVCFLEKCGTIHLQSAHVEALAADSEDTASVLQGLPGDATLSPAAETETQGRSAKRQGMESNSRGDCQVPGCEMGPSIGEWPSDCGTRIPESHTATRTHTQLNPCNNLGGLQGHCAEKFLKSANLERSNTR